MSGQPIQPARLGTRRSPMALAQARQVVALLAARTGREVEIVGLTTQGDVNRAQLTQIGGTGVFVSALRDALLTGEIDVAVHSLKDLPSRPDPRLRLAAVPPRDDPRDALVARNGAKLADLPGGASVGTGSPRRAAQVLLLRPDLRPVPIRGNAGTRLAKVTTGEVDAVVLGHAGLARIGHLDLVSQVFEPDEMVPAPGQGALAVECRADDQDLAAWLGAIDDPASRAATSAERAVLAALQAGCAAPVGAYAAVLTRGATPGAVPAVPTRAATPGAPAIAGWLRLDAIVVSPDGDMALRASADGPAGEAERLGRAVAADLLEHGAGRYTDVSSGGLGEADVDTSTTGTM